MLSALVEPARRVSAPWLCGVAAALALATPLPGTAQEPSHYTRARAELAAGDTVAALATLRQLTRTEHDFASGWGLLGRVLTAKASGVATDFEERVEAGKALERALKLDPENPLYLFTLGQLKRKQQIYLDARRLLNRAAERMKESPERLPLAERAELWFQRGLFYEDEYLDTRHLVWLSELPVHSPNCDAGTFCLNFQAPERFNEYFRHAADLSEYGEDDFERMADAFQRALEADPGHSGAFRRLAIHLIDRGEYEPARSLTLRYVEAAPESPWGYITLGLMYQRTGRDSLAEVHFERGLELAPPGVTAHYRDISPVLPDAQAKEYSSANDAVRKRLEEVLWRKSDPLYLTGANEVRLAHLARVAYADLMFEDPSEGIWGSETEQGVIYVRYGPPERIWKLHRDASKEISLAEVINAFEILQAGSIGEESLFSPIRNISAQGGGRWIFWNYGWHLPNFIFQKQLRWRRASHPVGSYSKFMEEELHKSLPAVYRMSFEILGYPVQVARFKGRSDGLVEADLYSEIPSDRLQGDVQADSIQAALFLFFGAEHTPVHDRSLTVPALVDRVPLTYGLPLAEGRYVFSLEARARHGAAAAVRRDSLKIEPFPADSLSLSDLVLADAVAPLTEEPAGRRDFALKVNRRLEFERAMPVAAYWEVYGLSAQDDGFAHYRVRLNLEDLEGRGVVAGIVRALRGVLGGGERGPSITYESTVELTGDRVPDFVTLNFASEKAGSYRLRVEVTDLRSGQAATAERVFTIVQQRE